MTVPTFDYNIIDDLAKISFSRSRYGVMLFNDMKIEGEINKKTQTITPACFEGYDYGLFGDIHRHQHLNPDTMAFRFFNSTKSR